MNTTTADAGSATATDQPGARQLRRSADDKMLGGLNSFFLLVDRPEVYHLPADPQLPSRRVRPSALLSVLGGVMVGLAGLVSFRTRGRRE